jgi:hypothetical protein
LANCELGGKRTPHDFLICVITLAIKSLRALVVSKQQISQLFSEKTVSGKKLEKIIGCPFDFNSSIQINT